jgi:hypothetical protein
VADSSVQITAGSGTPIRVLTGLGTGSADQQVVTLADSAGNLLGTTGAPVPTVVSSALPAGTNLLGTTALPASTLVVTATGAANAIVTATLAAPGAGLFQYVTSVQIQRFMTAAGTAAGTAVLTSGANHSLVWNQPTDAAAQGVQSTVVDYRPTTPLRATTANTAMTFITAAVAGTIYRINVTYYTA